MQFIYISFFFSNSRVKLAVDLPRKFSVTEMICQLGQECDSFFLLFLFMGKNDCASSTLGKNISPLLYFDLVNVGDRKKKEKK